MIKNRADALETQIDILADRMEGMDLYTVLSILANSEGESLPEFIDSHIAKELISATQSNPVAARNAVIRIARMDNYLGNL